MDRKLHYRHSLFVGHRLRIRAHRSEWELATELDRIQTSQSESHTQRIGHKNSGSSPKPTDRLMLVAALPFVVPAINSSQTRRLCDTRCCPPNRRTPRTQCDTLALALCVQSWSSLRLPFIYSIRAANTWRITERKALRGGVKASLWFLSLCPKAHSKTVSVRHCSGQRPPGQSPGRGA